MNESATGIGDNGIGDDQDVAGLAGERTDLAWSRSGLAAFVCVLAIAKRLLPNLSTMSATAIVGVALVVLAIVGGLGLIWAKAVAENSLAGVPTRDPRRFLLVTCITTGFAAVAIVVAFLPY